MSIKSPTEALEHISLLDGHHSVLLAVFTVQHPLRITQAASWFEAGVLGGILSWALILDTLHICFSDT